MAYYLCLESPRVCTSGNAWHTHRLRTELTLFCNRFLKAVGIVIQRPTLSLYEPNASTEFAPLLPQSVLCKFLPIRRLDQRGDGVRIHQRYGNKGVLRCSLAF